jgi:hypothetical protein
MYTWTHPVGWYKEVALGSNSRVMPEFLCFSGSRPDEVKRYFFLIYLILPASLGPGVFSSSNNNEYQMQTNNVSGE